MEFVGEAGKDPKFFQYELVKVYGHSIPYDQFLKMAQNGDFRLPPSVLADLAEVASAPSSATAVAPVETAVAPVAQFAPSVSLDERKKFEEKLAGQNGRIEEQAKVLADLQGQLKQALANNKSTEAQKTQVTALQGEVTKLQTALKVQADKASKGISDLTMAKGEDIAEVSSKLQKQIDTAVANASAVLGRVSAVENDVKDIKSLPIVKYGTPVLYAMVGTMLVFLFALGVIVWRRLSDRNKASANVLTSVRFRPVGQRVEPHVDDAVVCLTALKKAA